MKRMVACIVGFIALSNVFGQTVTDIDGYTYKTVTIGTQTWMAENLNTKKYSDGTAIPFVINSTVWCKLSTGAFCYYDDNADHAVVYGMLYNWYAVDTASNGGKNICPQGWHVPSDAEWTILSDYLGGAGVAGGKLKESGTIHWTSPNTGATNETGFTALPGGWHYGNNGSFYLIGITGHWWSSSANLSGLVYYRYLNYDNSHLHRYNTDDKHDGFSVRCVKD